MKIIDTIKESTIKQIVSGIFGILILLIGLIFPDIIPGIFRYLIQNLSKEALIRITSLAILLSVLLFGLSLLLYLKSRKQLTPKCGILWDRNKEPYCPACEKPLSEYHFSYIPADPYYEFTCIQCDKNIRLMHNSKPISLEEAQKLL